MRKMEISHSHMLAMLAPARNYLPVVWAALFIACAPLMSTSDSRPLT